MTDQETIGCNRTRWAKREKCALSKGTGCDEKRRYSGRKTGGGGDDPIPFLQCVLRDEEGIPVMAEMTLYLTYSVY